MQRNLKDYLIISAKGLAMGAADVVPGVSGGTIAFISGIYEELIETINGLELSFFSTWKKEGFKTSWKKYNLSFLTALFLGIVTSILSLAKLIKWLLNNEPLLLWGFFFGLVLASIVYIGKQITAWKPKVIITMLLAAILSYFITIAEPIASPDSNWYLMFCGFIAIIAMILPGVSGAFILLILGVYQTAINILNQLREGLVRMDFDILWQAISKIMVMGIGALVGLKLFSKVLNWMFKHHHNITLAILTGFMIGSLNKLWPWKKVISWRTNSEGLQVPFIEKSIFPTQFDGDIKIIWVLFFIALGFLLILVLERLSEKKTN
jgi:putative membrane protein